MPKSHDWVKGENCQRRDAGAQREERKRDAKNVRAAVPGRRGEREEGGGREETLKNVKAAPRTLKSGRDADESGGAGGPPAREGGEWKGDFNAEAQGRRGRREGRKNGGKSRKT